jgi:hypothetical protein
MLYYGMWRSMFAFHTEDMELHSINYLHCGAPKSWYAISPADYDRFVSLAQSTFPDRFDRCRQFMRHKTCLLSPKRIKESGINVRKVLQKEGEFVITFPSSFHGGFNHGFNIAESVNFATPQWVPYGYTAEVCQCQKYTFRIQMPLFEAAVAAATAAATARPPQQRRRGRRQRPATTTAAAATETHPHNGKRKRVLLAGDETTVACVMMTKGLDSDSNHTVEGNHTDLHTTRDERSTTTLSKAPDVKDAVGLQNVSCLRASPPP